MYEEFPYALETERPKDPYVVFSSPRASKKPGPLPGPNTERRLQNRDRSTPTMEVASAERDGDATVLALGHGGEIRITDEERFRLEGGVALAPDHPLSKRFADGAPEFVLRPADNAEGTDNAEGAEGSGKEQDAEERLLSGIGDAYPDSRVRLGRGEAGTSERLARVAEYRATPESTVAIIADGAFAVNDAKVLQNLRSELEPHLSVVTARRGEQFARGDGVRTVLFITGHQSPALVAFIQELGAQGVFADALVILQSCGGPYSRTATQAILDAKALAVIRPSGEIRASQVEKFALAIARELPSGLSVTQLLRQMRSAKMRGFVHTTVVWRKRRAAYA